MSKPMIRIHNLETDEVLDREMTDTEYSKYLALQEASALEKSEIEKKKVAREALLNRLGLTEDEAKLLLA